MNRTRWSLIDAVQAGEEAAQQEFISRYQSAVQRYLRRRGLPAAEAEDVAQEVFVRLMVHGALERARREGGSFRSFLFTVTRNTLGHHLAKRQAAKRGGAAQIVELKEHDAASPEEREAFDREWLLHLIELAMARLRREHENYFRALRGFLWGEESQAKLAERLGIREQDVRNHVHRGKQKLIAYLQEEVHRYEHEPTRHATEVELLARLLA